MLTDEEVIEILARRADEECGFSQLSNVLNHYSWVDVFTHLMMEKNLRTALLEAYKGEIASAMALKDLRTPRGVNVAYDEWKESGKDYLEWKADVATRGGT